MTDFIDQLGLQRTDPMQTLQLGATATGNGTAMMVRGMEGVMLHVVGITTATIVIQGTDADGNTSTLTVKDMGTGASTSSITANGFYAVVFEGLHTINAIIQSYTSGTITVTGSPASVFLARDDASIQQSAAIIPSATTMQNAATANGNGTVLTVTGYATAIINIISSVAMSGGTTVYFEASTDNFANDIQSILAHQIGQQGQQGSSTTSDGDYRINCSGFNQIRARIGNYSAGTTTIKGYVSPLAGVPSTVGISGSNDTAQTDATQTTSIGSFIKGLVKIWKDVWDSVNHYINVNPAALSQSSDSILIYPRGTNYVNLSASGQALVGPGKLACIWVSSASGSPTIKVWDNTAGSGTILMNTFTPAPGTMYKIPFGRVANGVYITIGGTVDCTVFVDPTTT